MFVTPVVEHWLEREIAQWVHPMKDRPDDPSHHERTLLPRSYVSLHPLTHSICILLSSDVHDVISLSRINRYFRLRLLFIWLLIFYPLPSFFVCLFVCLFFPSPLSSLIRSGQARSECLPCRFRASCCSARLPRADSSVRDRKAKRVVEGVMGVGGGGSIACISGYKGVRTSSPTGIGSRRRVFEVLWNLECPVE